MHGPMNVKFITAFKKYGHVPLSSARFIRSTTSHQYSYLPHYPKSSYHMYNTNPRTRQ